MGVGWANVVVTSSPSNRFNGQTISAIAASRQQDDFDCVYDLLLEESNRVGVVYFTISPEDIVRIMQHPAVMIGSDSGALAPYGPLSQGKPHPRTYGTFARVLGKYVREGVLSLERAVSKMTSLPAQKLGLHNRGLIRPGFAADLVLFSPEAINDTATYTEPHAYPTGVHAVVVNGVLSVEEGEHTGAGAGKVLRRPA
jgi:N-acyl-D-amino-acid deacylase